LKVIFPVAGFGTRFLPATKATPKEMLPIVDKPLIQYAVEEAAAAGATEMIFVTGRNKRAIEDYFDRAYELEAELTLKNDAQLLEQLRSTVPPGAKFIFIRQGDPLGLGHAVLCARPAVGDNPFAVILADELLDTPPNEPNPTAQLINAFRASGKSVIGVGHAEGASIERYGCVDIARTDSAGLMTLRGMVEKPKQADAPSSFGAFGRYVFAATLFDHLEQTKPGRGGEIQLTDAIAALIADPTAGAVAVNMQARRYDCGTKLGFLEATVDFALRHPELGVPFAQWLRARGELSTHK
jgi:UTP--glucose-1-phosphate uridylyltransferase